jgi:hypothetical protein
MQQFIVHVKNKNKIITKFGLLFNHVMALLLFGLGMLFFTAVWWKYTVLGISMAAIIYFLFNYKAIKQRFNFIDFLALLFETLVLIIVLKIWAVAIITAVQVYLFIEMRKATRFTFNDDAIILKGPFLNKKYLWALLNNVILKDDVLTLDFKSNKIIQEEVDAEKSKMDQLAFNSYCHKQLATTQQAALNNAGSPADESFKL